MINKLIIIIISDRFMGHVSLVCPIFKYMFEQVINYAKILLN